MSTFQVVLHEYNDSTVGHVNIEWRLNGNSYAWYGNNVVAVAGSQLGFEGGVVEETFTSRNRITAHPANHREHVFTVSESAWTASVQSAANMANSTSAGGGTYDAIGGNCVDWANSILVQALGRDPDDVIIDDYLQLSSPAKNYAWAKDFADAMYELWQLYIQMGAGSYDGDLGTEFGAALNAFYIAGTIWGIYDGPRRVELQATFDSGWASPLVLDLNGDGISTTSLDQSTVLFDITGDSAVERTGWIDPADAFLARDLDGNGRIDGYSELFGGGFGEGVSQLTALDSDHDGKISATDAAFDTLLVWQDANSDGISQADELKQLAAAGVQELDLGFTLDNPRTDNGNLLLETSTATLADGRTIELTDVYFRTAPTVSSPSVPSAETAAPVTSSSDPAVLSQVRMMIDAMTSFDPAADVVPAEGTIEPDLRRFAVWSHGDRSASGERCLVA